MVELIINSDASENINYNFGNLPIYIIEGFLSEYPGYRAICHWHSDIEFMYIYEGEMDYNVNGDIISLQAGQGLFINRRSLHYGFSDSRSDCKYLCIIFDPYRFCSCADFASNLLDPLFENPSIPYIRLSNSEGWQSEVMLSLVKLLQAQKNKTNTFSVLHQVIDLIALLANNYSLDNPVQKSDSNLLVLTQILGFIQENYMNKISVNELAAAGSCCKTTCSELFRKYLRTTPINYLTLFRLEMSSQKLALNNLSITEIAYECGFSNSSYFSEVFRKHYRLTPNEYRQKSIHTQQ